MKINSKETIDLILNQKNFNKVQQLGKLLLYCVKNMTGHISVLLEGFKNKSLNFNSLLKEAETIEALHEAIKNNNYIALELLLKYGVDANAIHNNNLPLQTAIEQKLHFYHLCKILIKYGADPDKKGKDNKTAKDLAIEKGYSKLFDLFINYNVTNKSDEENNDHNNEKSESNQIKQETKLDQGYEEEVSDEDSEEESEEGSENKWGSKKFN